MRTPLLSLTGLEVRVLVILVVAAVVVVMCRGLQVRKIKGLARAHLKRRTID